MTTDDWWAVVELCTVEGDWNGILVAADAFQELGDEKTAEGLRWVIEKGTKPARDYPNARITFELNILDHRWWSGWSGDYRRAWMQLLDKRQRVLDYLTR